MNPLNSVSNFQSPVKKGPSTKSTAELTKSILLQKHLLSIAQAKYKPKFSERFLSLYELVNAAQGGVV
jgi:hypothetical protein